MIRFVSQFWDIWWTCGACHATYPYDYEPDYCANDCGSRLRRNDDTRVATALTGKRSSDG